MSNLCSFSSQNKHVLSIYDKLHLQSTLAKHDYIAEDYLLERYYLTYLLLLSSAIFFGVLAEIDPGLVVRMRTGPIPRLLYAWNFSESFVDSKSSSTKNSISWTLICKSSLLVAISS